MAKPLIFQWGDGDVRFSISKVDRSKLYGYKEVEVVDSSGGICDLATLADDGRTMVGVGGTAMGYLDADRMWREKSELKPVDVDGDEIEPVGSSFSAPIKLFDTATDEEYLSHNIRLVYQLHTEDGIDDLVEQLRSGTIFTFPYSYRGGLEADAGFMLMNAKGEIFLAVGDPTSIEFIGIQNTGAVEEPEAVDETDLMDFDMI